MTNELWISEPCFYRGLAYEALREYQEAMQSYTQVIELNLEFTDRAYVQRGRIYCFELGKYQEAIQDFSQAIEWLESPTVDVFPSRAGVYPVLLRPLHITHAHRKHTTQKAFAYRHRAAVYALLTRHQEAMQDYAKSLALDPQSVSDQRYSRGDRAIWGSVWKLQEPYAFWQRGVAFAELGEDQEAIRACTQAIEFDAQYIGAYQTRAAAYVRLHRLPEAIQDLTKVIELKPEDAETYWVRAVAYHHIDQWELALKDYQHAARLGYEPAQSYLREQGWQW